MSKFQQSRQDLMWLVMSLMSLMMHHLIISNNPADPYSLHSIYIGFFDFRQNMKFPCSHCHRL